MRLPRVRFTVRRMMVIVAVVGGGSGAYVGIIRGSRLADTYRWRAAEHRMWEAVHRESAERFHNLWVQAVENRDPECEDYRSTAEWDEKRVEHHGAMMRKYDYYARHPWLPIPPDPPEPK